MKATKTELKQELGRLLREAFVEPVIITDRRKDSHVLMTVEFYEKMKLEIEELRSKVK